MSENKNRNINSNNRTAIEAVIIKKKIKEKRTVTSKQI